jgi:hypothetical protein
MNVNRGDERGHTVKRRARSIMGVLLEDCDRLDGLVTSQRMYLLSFLAWRTVMSSGRQEVI